MTPAKKRILFLFVGILLIGGTSFYVLEEKSNWTIDEVKRKDLKSYGLNRWEKEFKYIITSKKSLDINEIGSIVKDALFKLNQNNNFKMTKILQQEYAISETYGVEFFKDIYFDTADLINYKTLGSYRLRQRFESYDQYRKHLQNPSSIKHFPHRASLQTKTNHKVVDGQSWSFESRFILYAANPMIKGFMKSIGKIIVFDNFPKPQKLIEVAQTGKSHGQYLEPAVQFAKYINQYDSRKSFKLRPILTSDLWRKRFHMVIQSPWIVYDSEAFIVSIDKFRAKTLSPMKTKKAESPYFWELEVELDVSSSHLLEEIKEVVLQEGCHSYSPPQNNTVEYILNNKLKLTKGEKRLYKRGILGLIGYLKKNGFQVEHCESLISGIDRILGDFDHDKTLVFNTIKKALNTNQIELITNSKDTKYHLALQSLLGEKEVTINE